MQGPGKSWNFLGYDSDACISHYGYNSCSDIGAGAEKLLNFFRQSVVYKGTVRVNNFEKLFCTICFFSVTINNVHWSMDAAIIYMMYVYG